MKVIRVCRESRTGALGLIWPIGPAGRRARLTGSALKRGQEPGETRHQRREAGLKAPQGPGVSVGVT